jgi:dTDP-4-amino-4,6-dideoxygalactose transaminase
VQFIDLAAQQRRIRDRIQANLQTVLDHGKYIMGPEVGQLEQTLANYAGTKHAIACSSGTDALLLALMAYDVGPGDAIFTSPFTFIATAEVIQLLGATPVFVDIDPDTYNLDPDHLQRAISAVLHPDKSDYALPKKQSLRPKGIIAVDVFGLPADYERINQIAGKAGLFVIEDAAQSFGASQNGKTACALGDIGCTSFFPAKPLGCYGDGGMCFSDNDRIADVLRSIRVHGKGTHKYDNCRIGINGRLDTLQASILLAKFDIFADEVRLRQKVAQQYDKALMDTALKLPVVPEGFMSVWAQYSVLAADQNQRDTLQKELQEQGVPTAVYYPTPLHLQTAFANLHYQKDDFSVSESTAQRIISLPMHPYLSVADQEKITMALKKCV